MRTLLGDVTWTRWSRFHATTITFDNPVEPPRVQARNWHDTLRGAFGIGFVVTPRMTLRAGVAYDESAVSDRYRTADIPVSARTSGSLGVTFRATSSATFDVSYAYGRNARARIRDVDPQAGSLSGDFDRELHAVGAQASLRF